MGLAGEEGTKVATWKWPRGKERLDNNRKHQKQLHLLEMTTSLKGLIL